jgi:hypothetical protein
MMTNRTEATQAFGVAPNRNGAAASAVLIPDRRVLACVRLDEATQLPSEVNLRLGQRLLPIWRLAGATRTGFDGGEYLFGVPRAIDLSQSD